MASENNLDFSNTILVFTDGACSGNPGRGGYGTIIVYPEGKVEELGEFDPSTTNNKMEISAVIAGLSKISRRSEDVWVLTDSTYVIRGITQWIWGWKKKGWLNAQGDAVANQELWKDLDRLVFLRKKESEIEWKYVRGHTGNPGNERCDEIAVSFTKTGSADLFRGDLLRYPVAIHDLPDDMSLPPPSSESKNKSKKKAFSYLSYVNGQLERHQTWSECEARVKGRPGAKFKKSLSADDEKEIVRSWGLDPSQLGNI